MRQAVKTQPVLLQIFEFENSLLPQFIAQQCAAVARLIAVNVWNCSTIDWIKKNCHNFCTEHWFGRAYQRRNTIRTPEQKTNKLATRKNETKWLLDMQSTAKVCPCCRLERMNGRTEWRTSFGPFARQQTTKYNLVVKSFALTPPANLFTATAGARRNWNSPLHGGAAPPAFETSASPTIAVCESQFQQLQSQSWSSLLMHNASKILALQRGRYQLFHLPTVQRVSALIYPFLSG